VEGGWRPGTVIAHRGVVDGRTWIASPMIVVEDEPELLVAYTPEGAPFVFPRGDFPRGEHPWSRQGKTHWHGHGALQLLRPGDYHSVLVFWHGPERAFGAWYVNFQDPFRRTAVGIDTQDLALDIVVRPDGSWSWKDRSQFEELVRDGFIRPDQAAAVRAESEQVAVMLDRGEHWWDSSWAEWRPDPAWPVPELPAGWDAA
jgi:hypothetical protein